jgi:hypothetical protein
MAAVGRMLAGLVLLGFALYLGFVTLVSCQLASRSRGSGEGMPVDTGESLTHDLVLGMTDAEIAATVDLANATVLELRRAPDSTVVIVSFRTDAHDAASTLECREVVLTTDTSTYDEVDCPVR